MTDKELKELYLLISDQIQLIEEEIIELTELTKPISLDASILLQTQEKLSCRAVP